MIKSYIVKDKNKISIKYVTIADFEKNKNFKYYYDWRSRVDDFLRSKTKIKMLEEVRKKFYDNLAHPDENIMIGAFYKDKLIGLTYLYRNIMNERIKHIGKWGIVIHPDFQNQGIGTIMLKNLENRANQIGIIKLEASFQSRNHIAEHLYIEKLHYKIEGIKKLAILLENGTFDDEILIGKLLNSKNK